MISNPKSSSSLGVSGTCGTVALGVCVGVAVDVIFVGCVCVVVTIGCLTLSSVGFCGFCCRFRARTPGRFGGGGGIVALVFVVGTGSDV